MKTLKDMSRAGVTLVELLVVILIVTILAVSLLPMFRKFVNQAQYAAEAKPLIGHLRTQISLYQYDNGNMLPTAVNTESDLNPKPRLLGVMSFQATGDNGAWQPYFDTDFDGEPDDDAASWSFLRMMDIPISEMQGNHMTPGHLEFAVQRNGAVDADTPADIAGAYAYAIGIFGREGGLQPGTGYAVYEAFFPKVAAGQFESDSGIQNKEHGFKLIGTFERMSADGGEKHFGYKPGEDKPEICVISQLTNEDFSVETIEGIRDLMDEMDINAGGEWKFQGI